MVFYQLFKCVTDITDEYQHIFERLDLSGKVKIFQLKGVFTNKKSRKTAKYVIYACIISCFIH